MGYGGRYKCTEKKLICIYGFGTGIGSMQSYCLYINIYIYIYIYIQGMLFIMVNTDRISYLQ